MPLPKGKKKQYSCIVFLIRESCQFDTFGKKNEIKKCARKKPV